MNHLIDAISESFIWGVGITRPEQSKKNGAALYITVILVGTVVLTVATFLFLVDKL